MIMGGVPVWPEVSIDWSHGKIVVRNGMIQQAICIFVLILR